MKRKLKLKPYIISIIYVGLFVGAFYATLVVSNSLSKENISKDNNDNLDYVNESIIDKEVPVISEDTKKMGRPYTDENVKIGKYFYDYKADSKTQQNAITYHDNTYMQNSGIDYILEEVFDVVSVLDGEVSNVSSDDLLGKIVEIKHDNGMVSVYQSLSTITVKKGDAVKKGQAIGKSGSNELDKEMGNHLHFELYVNGGVVDPNLYIDKEIKEENKKASSEDSSINNSENN